MRITGTIVIDLTKGDRQWVEDNHEVWVVADSEPAGVPVKLVVGNKWAPAFLDDLPFIEEHWKRLVSKHPITVEGSVHVGDWVRFLRRAAETA